VIQFVLLGLVGLAGLLGPAWDGSARIAAGLVGVGALVIGLWLAWRGLRDLDTALTPLPHPRDGSELVQHGAYALVRHPIYGGIVVGAAGFGLVLASPAAVVGSAVLLVFFRLKSGREEAWLRDRYPGYAAYAARTRRMLPFVY
jgi:protein-S-isoprenylcysteine O-methyltransferase Ste14